VAALSSGKALSGAFMKGKKACGGSPKAVILKGERMKIKADRERLRHPPFITIGS
jgi:hypothetical protein